MGVRAVTIGLVVVGVAVGFGLLVHRPSPPRSDVPGIEHYDVPKDHLYLFQDVAGPSQSSVVPVTLPPPSSRYATGGPSRLAILLTEPQSNWLGLAHGLKSIGVPFVVTEDPTEALRHRVVMVYPAISGRALPAEALKALAAQPRKGGTLIGSAILGGGLEAVFGFSEQHSSQDHERLQFTEGSSLLASLTDPKERTIRLGNRAKGMSPIGTRSYASPKEPPLALFEDGSGAITQRSYGWGMPTPSG